MNSSHLINIGFAALLMTMLSVGSSEAQARGSNRNQQKMMLQQLKIQMQQKQAQQAEEARQTGAIAAETHRKFELHKMASKARNEKIEADRAAAKERRLSEAEANAKEKPKSQKPSQP